ncbi:hypothetical protein EN35_05085 [Rhodococcus qingshengii]|nr:hypothetical protein EN35_05085 [Rhodococcus qingshengii]
MTDEWRWTYAKRGRRHQLRRDKNDIEIYNWRLNDEQLQAFCDAGTDALSGQRSRVGEFYAHPLRREGELHITWIRRHREPSNMLISQADLVEIITAADQELLAEELGVSELVHVSR